MKLLTVLLGLLFLLGANYTEASEVDTDFKINSIDNEEVTFWIIEK